MTRPKIPLGKTNLQIAPLGTGAWAWGDKLFWGFGSGYADSDVKSAFDASLGAGIDFFDTAEVYGSGRSEKFLGEFTRQTNQPVFIATKFFPYPWRWRQSNLLQALRGSLQRLGLKCVDLYQLHQSFPPVPIETWMAALAEAVDAGLARAVGVSNYNAEQTRRAHATLARRGIPLASNQVKYSLLDRRIERNGVMNTCRELGVTVIAYSPIEMGLLSGKYTPENPVPGLRSRRYSRAYLARIQPLIVRLREIGMAHGKTPAQVALNWTMRKSTVPIPGAKNARQAQENAGALGWRLSEDEIAVLDTASDRVSQHAQN
jgi:aryl-alcohol dehydrogenase-like predicted oxidoreductase